MTIDAEGQLIDGFLRRARELGARSENVENVLMGLTAWMAVYRTYPGKERQYTEGFLKGVLLCISRMSDADIAAMKNSGENPITDPSAAITVRKGIQR